MLEILMKYLFCYFMEVFCQIWPFKKFVAEYELTFLSISYENMQIVNVNASHLSMFNSLILSENSFYT